MIFVEWNVPSCYLLADEIVILPQLCADPTKMISAALHQSSVNVNYLQILKHIFKDILNCLFIIALQLGDGNTWNVNPNQFFIRQAFSEVCFVSILSQVEGWEL